MKLSKKNYCVSYFAYNIKFNKMGQMLAFNLQLTGNVRISDMIEGGYDRNNSLRLKALSRYDVKMCQKRSWHLSSNLGQSSQHLYILHSILQLQSLHQKITSSSSVWTLFSIEMDSFQHAPWLIITSFTYYYQLALDLSQGP